jgi:hypothetical protein
MLAMEQQGRVGGFRDLARQQSVHVAFLESVGNCSGCRVMSAPAQACSRLVE